MAVSKSSRKTRRSGEPSLPEPSLMGRVIWLVATAIWVFLGLSLATFDIADWPSGAVGVLNEPAANLGGEVGAILAWWAYAATGLGAWVVFGFGAIALYVLFSGRKISHPLVRTVGVMLAAIAVGALQQAWIPEIGPVPGSVAE